MFLWQNCTNCSLLWSLWISLSLLYFFQGGWLTLNILCKSLWQHYQKRQKHPLESHNLFGILVLWFRLVHHPEPHAWFWILWIQVEIFLPLRMKAKGRMPIFPCLLSTERLSQLGKFWKSILTYDYCGWGLNDSEQWFFVQPWKQELQQPMLCFPGWIHRSATSCLTLISDSEKLSSVLLPDFYKYSFKMSKPTFSPQKGPWTSRNLAWNVSSFIIALRNFLN